MQNRLANILQNLSKHKNVKDLVQTLESVAEQLKTKATDSAIVSKAEHKVKQVEAILAKTEDKLHAEVTKTLRDIHAAISEVESNLENYRGKVLSQLTLIKARSKKQGAKKKASAPRAKKAVRKTTAKAKTTRKASVKASK